MSSPALKHISKKSAAAKAALKNTKLKKNKGSDSDDDSTIFDDDDEDDSDYETVTESDSSYVPPAKSRRTASKRSAPIAPTDDSDEELDHAELQKFLSRVFPSKYMKEKATLSKLEKKDAEKKAKKIAEKEEEERVVAKYLKKKAAAKRASALKKLASEALDEEEDEEEEEEDASEAAEEDEDEEEEDSEVEEEEMGDEKKFNIVFTLGDGTNDADYEDGFEEPYNDEEDQVDCDSDDEQVFMKEKYVPISLPEQCTSDPLSPSDKKRKQKIQAKADKEKAKKEKEPVELTDVEQEYLDLVDTKKQLSIQLHKQPKNKILMNALNECSDSIKKLVKQTRIKNAKTYHRLINDDGEYTDEVSYFKKNLSNKEQLKVVNDLKEINAHIQVTKPYRLALLECNLPPKYKAIAMQKLNVLRMMDPSDNEYYKIKNWVDTFMRIPFGIYKNLSVNIDDGLDTCHQFMEKSKTILDDCAYGLNDAKMQIMQMVGQWISNPGAMGTAIAIKGPMGTGKCHTFDTPILMYDGSIKMVQHIEIGDIVMGDDSTPRNVMALGRGQDELYDVIPVKGESYGVNSEHILCLKQSGIGCVKPIKNASGSMSYKTIRFSATNRNLETKNFSSKEAADSYLAGFSEHDKTIEISIKDYLKLPAYIRKDWLKGYRVGVDFKKAPVLFNPYIIGVWLGDGASNQSRISNKDAKILHYLKTELRKDNLSLNYVAQYDYGISSDSRNGENVFLKSLQHYNLINNKHIPNDYKINDRETRMQMLAGLLDTDGYYDKKGNVFEITQKSKQLSDDILYLARSLGFAAYQKECVKSCDYKGEKKYGRYHCITISGNNLDEIPTKCDRKQAAQRKQIKDPMVTGIQVVSRGYGDYYGFTLDGNHRYLIGDFTVTHNTTLVKEGISKILGREFSFIALGGTGDASFLEGHSYTYEGSTWGKIVQILLDSKCMNPVIYFDELDKVSGTPRGDEIIGILTHLTDTSQNSEFHDKYFSEVSFDLSKCLFIFSYNDESLVNPILRDRMYRIQTKGYDTKEKMVIARKHLLPKICEQVRFTADEVIISDETLEYIITNDSYTMGEDGVRNLKRCLEVIHTKLNLYRLVKPGSTMFGKDMEMAVEFPFTVTKKDVDTLIKSDTRQNQSLLSMYV